MIDSNPKPRFYLRHFVPAVAVHLIICVILAVPWSMTTIPLELTGFLWVTLLLGQASVLAALGAQWFVAAGTKRAFLVALFSYLVAFAFLAGYFIQLRNYPFGFESLLLGLIAILPSLNAFLGARLFLNYLGHRFVVVVLNRSERETAVSTIPLQRLFVITACLAGLIGLARATPAHLYDTTAFVSISCAVILSIIGLLAISIVPQWVAFSECRPEYRWTVLLGTILTFSSLIPLVYELSWKWWAGFTFVISYLVLLQYVTLVPFRLAGFRLRQIRPPLPNNAPTNSLLETN